MSKKKSRPTDFTDVMCSKCGVTAHSKAGTHHRRCAGQEGKPKDKRAQRLPFAERGVWA